MTHHEEKKKKITFNDKILFLFKQTCSPCCSSVLKGFKPIKATASCSITATGLLCDFNKLLWPQRRNGGFLLKAAIRTQLIRSNFEWHDHVQDLNFHISEITLCICALSCLFNSCQSHLPLCLSQIIRYRNSMIVSFCFIDTGGPFSPISVYIIKHRLVDSITNNIHHCSCFRDYIKISVRVYLSHKFPPNFKESEAVGT